MNRERMKSSKHVSNYELEEFFNRTNDQITRMKSHQETNPAVKKTLVEKKNSNLKLNGQKLTSIDIFSLAYPVANKMNQNRYKIERPPLYGFRLPSMKFDYEQEIKKTSPTRRKSIRLTDILPKNENSKR